MENKILELITKHPGLDQSEIADMLNMNTYDVCVIVAKLAKGGLIVSEWSEKKDRIS